MSQETNNAKVLGEIDPNSDDWQLFANHDTSERRSTNRRRSSILKLSEAERRSSNRRVSWAQTFQYKEVLLDGTSVLTSQELNKCPINLNANTDPIPVMSEQKNCNDENVQNSNEKKCELNDIVVDENIQKIKDRFGQNHLPRILSRYYNPKNNSKDCTTVINTALNKYGVEIDLANPFNNLSNLFNLFKREHPSQEENFTAFLKHFHLIEDNDHELSSLKQSISNENQLIHTPTISSNSAMSNKFLNSTKISDANHSLDSFSVMADQSPIRNDSDSMNVDLEYNDDQQSMTEPVVKTLLDTTFMQLESNNSSHQSENDKVSESKKINPTTNNNGQEANIFVAKADNFNPHEMSLEMSLELSPTKKTTLKSVDQIAMNISAQTSESAADIEKVNAENFLKIILDASLSISDDSNSNKQKMEEFKIFVDNSCIAEKMPKKESPVVEKINFFKKLDDTPNTDYSISLDDDDDNDDGDGDDDDNANLKNDSNGQQREDFIINVDQNQISKEDENLIKHQAIESFHDADDFLKNFKSTNTSFEFDDSIDNLMAKKKEDEKDSNDSMISLNKIDDSIWINDNANNVNNEEKMKMASTFVRDNHGQNVEFTIPMNTESIPIKIPEQKPLPFLESTMNHISIFSSSSSSSDKPFSFSKTDNIVYDKTDDPKTSANFNTTEMSIQHEGASTMGVNKSVEHERKMVANEHFTADLLSMNLEQSTVDREKKLATFLTLSSIVSDSKIKDDKNLTSSNNYNDNNDNDNDDEQCKSDGSTLFKEASKSLLDNFELNTPDTSISQSLKNLSENDISEIEISAEKSKISPIEPDDDGGGGVRVDVIEITKDLISDNQTPYVLTKPINLGKSATEILECQNLEQQQINDKESKDDDSGDGKQEIQIKTKKSTEESVQLEKKEIEPLLENFKLPNLDLMRPSMKMVMKADVANQSAIAEQQSPMPKQITGSTVAEIMTGMSQLKSTLPPPTSISKMSVGGGGGGGGVRRSMFELSKNSSNFSRIPQLPTPMSKTSSFSFRIPLATPVNRPNTTTKTYSSEQRSNISQQIDKSYFENSILARKSLGVTLREKLIKRIDKQRQKEAEISKPNETKESEPIAETEQLNLEQQQIIDDDNELQSGLDQVTIESIQEQHDYFGSDEIETPERVLSPIEMEQSVAKMLNVDDLSEDHIETTETDVKAMENNDGDDYEEEEEEETDYNVNMSEMTGNFSMMLHDVSLMLADDSMEENKFEFSTYNSFTQSIAMRKQKKRLIQIPMFDFINDLDHRELNVRIQSVTPDQLVLRYLFSTLELRIHLGSSKSCRQINDDDGHEIREIVAMDLVSLIDSQKPLKTDVICGREDRPIYDWDFSPLKFKTDEHRQLLLLSHDYVHTHFEEKRSFFDKTFKDTSKLKELIQEFSILVTPAKKMAGELRRLLSENISHMLPKDQDGKIGISIEIFGIRINTCVLLHFIFDHLKYPDEVIHPIIIVPDNDRHLYPLEEFAVALKMIKPCAYNYISKLTRGSECFIQALGIIIKQEKLARRRSEQMRALASFEIRRSG
ncbi:uncharacterized protein LOC124498036 isoform X2 [Dermatophagoides farinae]|uniref:uncharacterized protein LOC124498036 isoform X2 n=1 Tax=Dermatophagoides farinae TaxID=6954 RepID=UPI003F61C354